MTDFRFEITAHPNALGGGWRLHLLYGDEERSSSIFPPPPALDDDVALWWDSLHEREREFWLTMSDDNPASAYRAYLNARAYAFAEQEASMWIERMQELLCAGAVLGVRRPG